MYSIPRDLSSSVPASIPSTSTLACLIWSLTLILPHERAFEPQCYIKCMQDFFEGIKLNSLLPFLKVEDSCLPNASQLGKLELTETGSFSVKPCYFCHNLIFAHNITGKAV